MLTRRYFRLRTLGRLTLTVVDGETESLADIRPRHLAVLAVIALSTKAMPRDKLVAMFWGDEDETRARHSLSNALSGLRAVLGADAITSLWRMTRASKSTAFSSAPRSKPATTGAPSRSIAAVFSMRSTFPTRRTSRIGRVASAVSSSAGSSKH